MQTTCTYGFKIKPRKFKRGELVQMMREIEQDPVFLNNEVKLKFDTVCEGGIQFTSWKGKTDEMYKSFRFPCFIYDWDDDDDPDLWTEDDEIIIPYRSSSKHIPTSQASVFIKAFDGAPVWTAEELTVFAQTFNRHSFIVTHLINACAKLRRNEKIIQRTFNPPRRLYKY